MSHKTYERTFTAIKEHVQPYLHNITFGLAAKRLNFLGPYTLEYRLKNISIFEQGARIAKFPANRIFITRSQSGIIIQPEIKSF